MPIPAALQDTIDLFRDTGSFFREGFEEMFGLVSWVQVMIGQGILPERCHPLAERMPEQDLAAFMAGVRQVVEACAEAMPMHQAFIDKVCPAPVPEAA